MSIASCLISSNPLAFAAQSRPMPALRIVCPEVFANPQFQTWVRGAHSLMKWSLGGGSSIHTTDIVVMVDPSLEGEGTDSDMPEDIWDMVIDACRKQFEPHRHAEHIMVWLSED